MLHGSRRLISIPIPCFKLQHRIKSDLFAQNKTTLDFFDLILRQCNTHQETKRAHAQIIVTGCNQSGFLAARLITVYTLFGFLADAQAVFQGTPVECKCNLLLWNSILRANLSYGYAEEALKLYFQMRNLGVVPDGFTFPLVVRACALIGDLGMCKAIQSHAVVSGFQFRVHVANELIVMYGKLGRMDHAQQVFDRMPCRSYISWNSLISGFCKNYDSEGAVKIFNWMELEGLEPNLVTWTSLLSAHARCGQCQDVLRLFGEMRMKINGATAEAVAVVLSVCTDFCEFYKGWEIHGYVIAGGFQDYMFVNNSLISLYGKHGNLEDARNLFLEMKVKNLISWNSLISSLGEAGRCDEAFEVFLQLQNSGDSMLKPNVITWSAVIAGFASKGRGNECLDLFRKMLQARIDPNSVTFASVLSVCAELAALDLGREIHGHSIRAHMDNNILVGNGLVNMFTKCGNLKEALTIYDKIEDRDLISWNSMIAGYGMHGFGEDALTTFHEMVKAGQRPDGVTFVAVLSACSRAGLVSEGRKLFDQMVNVFSIPPLMEHYSCMVDLLGRAGLLQDASEIVKKMPMEPNACVLGALLNSCRMHKNTELAEEVASKIFSLETKTTGSYMLLSNLYASCGSWEDSARVRMLAKTKGLKKNPGQSWIEVQNKVHMFFAGNALEPGLEEVYHILEDLGLQMELEGYIADYSFEFQDVYKEETRTVSANC